MNDDAALLRRYADENSESAFAELVHRHLDLVYSAAFRRLSNAHCAAEVAQRVFATLARNARKLSHHEVLTAWLYTATRNVAIDHIRSEQRRTAREHALGRENPGEGWVNVVTLDVAGQPGGMATKFMHTSEGWKMSSADPDRQWEKILDYFDPATGQPRDNAK